MGRKARALDDDASTCAPTATATTSISQATWTLTVAASQPAGPAGASARLHRKTAETQQAGSICFEAPVANREEIWAEAWNRFEALCSGADAAFSLRDLERQLLDVRRGAAARAAAQRRSLRVHIVFSGLVSAGKTTLMNSILVNGLEGFPSDLELFESDLLESAPCISTIEADPGAAAIATVREIVHVSGASGAVASCERRPSVREHEDIWALRRHLAGRPRGCAADRTSGRVAHRVGVTLPYKPVEGMLENRAKAGQLHQPWPLLVDTPGLDSWLMKEQLLAMLERKVFVFCFLVDITKPNPFGDQGFEILKFLADRVDKPFAPVIVFTKWEKFCSQWEGEHGKRFQRREASGQTKEQVATRFLEVVFEKLREANVQVEPYFAALNALEALQPLPSREPSRGKADEDGCQNTVHRAKAELSSFLMKVCDLRKQVEEPLLYHQLFCGLESDVEKILEIVQEAPADAGDLSPQAMDSARSASERLKHDFSGSLQGYFSSVEWTREGLTRHSPGLPLPFNAEGGAMRRVERITTDAAQEYKASGARRRSLRGAVEDVARSALQTVLHHVLADFQAIERAAVDAHWAALSRYLTETRVGIFKDTLGQPTFRPKYEKRWSAAAGSLSIGGLMAACTMGSVGVGVIACLPLAVGAAVLTRSRMIRRWEDVEQKALEEVLTSLRDGHDALVAATIDDFSKRVDKAFEKATSGRERELDWDARAAADDVREAIRAGKRQQQGQVASAMSRGIEGRWLAGDEKLKELWTPIFERHSSATTL